MENRKTLAHRKRTGDEIVNRLWTDDQLMRLIEQIHQGYTYCDVARNTPVPMSTLWTSVKGKYEGQIRPKTGAPGIFPQELEADFALYLKQCDMLRIPKTKQEFKEDIWHYVNYHNLTFKQLQEDGPGRTWFKRFTDDWSELVEFKTKGVIFRLKNDPITMRMWVNEWDKYTKIQKESKMFPSKEYIFVVEKRTLSVSLSNNISLEVLMIYNAQGQILSPFISHKGNIPKEVQRYFEDDICFSLCEDGHIDQTALVDVCMYIERHLAGNQLFESPVVYICPGVSHKIGFTLWDLCNRYNFVLQTVPQNIYNYLRTSNLGIFDKLEPAFYSQVQKEFPDGTGHCFLMNFFEILNKVILTSKMSSHLRNSCRHLRIVAIIHQVTEDMQMQEVHEELEVDDDEDDITSQQVEQEQGQQVNVQEDFFHGSELQNIIAQRTDDNLAEEELPDLEQEI